MENNKEDLSRIIAANLILLRTDAHLTQAELAEKLNYSDKTISKWERAESIPDVLVLKTLSDEFHVNVDWFLIDHSDQDAPLFKPNKRPVHRSVVWLSVLCVWFLATILFVLFSVLFGWNSGSWIAYPASLPASFIVLIVFNGIWGSRKLTPWLISGLVWTLITFVYLAILIFLSKNLWSLFFIGIPLQAALLVWYQLVRTIHKKA